MLVVPGDQAAGVLQANLRQFAQAVGQVFHGRTAVDAGENAIAEFVRCLIHFVGVNVVGAEGACRAAFEDGIADVTVHPDILTGSGTEQPFPAQKTGGLELTDPALKIEQRVRAGLPGIRAHEHGV